MNKNSTLSIDGLEKPFKLNEISCFYPLITEFFDKDSNRIKVTIEREETDRSKIEMNLAQKRTIATETEKRLNLHSEQLRNLYSLGVEGKKLHLELDDRRRGTSHRPIMSKAYKIYATFMLLLCAVLLGSISIQTLCFKSPIPDFVLVLMVSFVVYNIVEAPRILIFTVIFLIVSILFDFVGLRADADLDICQWAYVQQ